MSMTELLFADFIKSNILEPIPSQPMERIHRLVQSQTTISAKHGVTTKCPFKWVQYLVKKDGYLTLWHGTLSTINLHMAVYLSNGIISNALPRHNPLATEGILLFVDRVIIGAIPSLLTLTLVYPLDLARTVVSADTVINGSYNFSGAIDVMRNVVKKDGWGGLYTGFFWSCASILVYRASYYSFKDYLFPKLSVWFPNCSKNKRSSICNEETQAVGNRIISGIIAYPLDTIRSKIILNSLELTTYQGKCWQLQAAFDMIKSEGISSLYSGIATNVALGAVNAVVKYCFDKGHEQIFPEKYADLKSK